MEEVRRGRILDCLKLSYSSRIWSHVNRLQTKTPCHRHPSTLQRLDLLLRSPAAPADNSTGMAHGLARRRLLSTNHEQSNHYIVFQISKHILPIKPIIFVSKVLLGEFN